MASFPCEYLVFQDVDVLSVSGVDHAFRGAAAAWFLTAGGCKRPNPRLEGRSNNGTFAVQLGMPPSSDFRLRLDCACW